MIDLANQNQAEARELISFNDLDQIEPGTLFEITWVFRNSGSLTWDASYRLVYTDETHPETAVYPHTNLAAQAQYRLTELGARANIPPGDTVYLTQSFISPEKPGIYLTGWQLQTAGGERFGPVREVRIIVIEPSVKALGEFAYQVVGFNNSAADYNNMQASSTFTGTWSLKNVGIDPWLGDFKVVTAPATTADTRDATFQQMGRPTQITLHDLTGQDSVSPGAVVTLAMPFTAPTTPGIYAFHWQLTAADGQPFGGTRWMRIVVKKPDGTAPPRPVDMADYRYRGTAVQFFTGIHGPADDWMWGNDPFQRMMRKLDMPVFFWSRGANGDYAHFGSKHQNAVRLYWNPQPVSAEEAYKEIRDDQLRNWWNRGYRRFIFFNEPQFGMAIAKIEEGMNIAWHNKEQFARFLAHCLHRARQEFPGIQLFTTPMSSNEAFDPWGWRAHMWAQVQGLVDGWCMHAYSGNNVDVEAATQDIASQVIELQRRFQLQIPIIISEASVNRGRDAQQKARVAHLLQQKLALVPGTEAVFWYAADWSKELDEHHEGWFRNGIADAYIQQAS